MDAMKIVVTPNSLDAAHRPGWKLRTLRLSLRTLSAIAPGRAAALAERLWFTPPRARISDNAARFLDSAEPFAMNVDGCRVQSYVWGEGPAVALMHGWGSHSARWQPLVERLVAQGFSAVAFDGPSHGRSGPSAWGARQANFREFARGLLAIERRHGPLHALIAHSGGCTASAWAMRQGLVPTRAVFLAPMADPIAYAARYQRALGLSDAIMQRWQANAARRLGFDWSELDAARAPHHVRTPPVLVVHDRDDPDTFWTDGEAIARTWPRSELVLTEGLGHRGALRDEAVLARVLRFVQTGRVAETDAPRPAVALVRRDDARVG